MSFDSSLFVVRTVNIIRKLNDEIKYNETILNLYRTGVSGLSDEETNLVLLAAASMHAGYTSIQQAISTLEAVLTHKTITPKAASEVKRSTIMPPLDKPLYTYDNNLIFTLVYNPGNNPPPGYQVYKGLDKDINPGGWPPEFKNQHVNNAPPPEIGKITDNRKKIWDKNAGGQPPGYTGWAEWNKTGQEIAPELDDSDNDRRQNES
jgi:hypothetical protein